MLDYLNDSDYNLCIKKLIGDNMRELADRRFFNNQVPRLNIVFNGVWAKTNFKK